MGTELRPAQQHRTYRRTCLPAGPRDTPLPKEIQRPNTASSLFGHFARCRAAPEQGVVTYELGVGKAPVHVPQFSTPPLAAFVTVPLFARDPDWMLRPRMPCGTVNLPVEPLSILPPVFTTLNQGRALPSVEMEPSFSKELFG